MRFQKARQKAILELKILYDTAAKEVGEANAAIFEMQQAILEDQDFIDQITNIIATQKLNAEYAVQSVAEVYIRCGSEGERLCARTRCRRERCGKPCPSHSVQRLEGQDADG